MIEATKMKIVAKGDVLNWAPFLENRKLFIICRNFVLSIKRSCWIFVMLTVKWRRKFIEESEVK